jgi:hypothetical protein
MKIKEFIQAIAKETKFYIEKYEQIKDLSGKQKKARVDDVIIDYIENTIDTIGLNFVAKFIIKKLLIENIPVITQCIFDLIASKVQGITK